MKELYKISARSKDGHAYTVEILSESDDIIETFKKHLSKIGWDHYQYTITGYMMVAPEVSEDGIL